MNDTTPKNINEFFEKLLNYLDIKDYESTRNYDLSEFLGLLEEENNDYDNNVYADGIDFLTEGSPKYGNGVTDDRIYAFGVPLEFVESDGGGEGGSEEVHSIIKVLDGYIRFDYHYYSHHGYDMDYANLKMVKPQERTIVVYE